MLRLRRIELQGFKSFYERAEITVGNSGVTAVVGPNGCGKSNISDAVAWVLGEQRARSLRGDRMEDVIFSGSGRRAPLGMAEVTINLIDDAPAHTNGGPPPGPVELTVQRRLYRSGESQYLLNGRPCRLRDIQDVFLGTGLGPNNYAIIEQGRVGQLLSAKPTDRRALIEEAAGITKFKARRKLTESRLQAARDNLSRVNDILSEVDRQRNSLKRQAAKARRYREIKARLRTVLAAVFSTHAEQLIENQERVAVLLEGIGAEGQALEARIAGLERRVHAARAEVESQDGVLEEARERQLEAKLDLEKAGQRIERLSDQIRSLERRQAELDADETRVREEAQAQRSAHAAGIERLAAVEADIGDRRGEYAVGEDTLRDLARRQRDEEAGIDGLRNRRFDLVGHAARIGNELSAKEDLLRRLDAQVARVRREHEEATLAAEGCRAKLQAFELEQTARRSQIGRLALDRDRAARDREEIRAEHGRAQAEAAAARSQEEAVRHRLETIRELSLDRAYGTESVQQFFSQAREQAWAPVGILADFIEVEPDFEAIVEDLLHTELQYVVVESLTEAEKALALVRSATHGRLDFWVIDPGAASPSPSEPIEGARSVLDLVRWDDRLRAFAPTLANAYTVEDLTRAWDLAGRHPDKTFVARSGEVVRGRVISWGERSSHGPLSLKREMRELDRRAEEARQTARAAAERSEDLGGRARELDELFEELSRLLRESERDSLGLDHGVRHLAAELERHQQHGRTAEAEMHRSALDRTEVEAAMSAARSTLEETRARQGEIDREIGLRGATREELRAAAERQSAAVAELGARLAVLEERRETLVRERAALERAVGELEARGRQIREQIETAVRERAAALEATAAETQARAELALRRESVETRIREATERLETMRRELHGAEAEWDEARAAHDQWKDRQTRLGIERAETESELKHLFTRCLNELGERLESVCLDCFETLQTSDLEVYEQECQELRERIDAMGAVNMMAVEEHEEAEERFVFLTTQRQDLLDSIRDTSQAIEEIDAVCRRQFHEAFTEINRRFTEAFVELFGGGHGELRLIDEADAADAGIEIVAQPPGKKLQNVLLLSGGEKALTALALVISLFRFKPSPFCVLDEVDAPLDDANVERFASMIREMSDGTQFIVITHSKRTMETANQLYGVTMEEPGISKVVSVRLN